MQYLNPRRLMRRLLTLCLAAALLLSLPGAALANQFINTITITVVTLPKAGESPNDACIIDEGTLWPQVNPPFISGWYQDEAGTTRQEEPFENGTTYWFIVFLESAGPWDTSPDSLISVTINDEPATFQNSLNQDEPPRVFRAFAVGSTPSPTPRPRRDPGPDPTPSPTPVLTIPGTGDSGGIAPAAALLPALATAILGAALCGAKRARR